MKLILDLDTGIDDALALTYALGQPEAELIGVTTTFGNVTIDKAVKNTLDLLALLNREDVPVFRGSVFPWGSNSYQTTDDLHRVHGLNGIGNVVLLESSKAVQSQSAVDFLIESAENFGEDLTIVTAGPLTNLAEAIKKNSTAMSKVGRIVMMAGALTIPGNLSPFAEANVLNDPLAAKFVLESGISFTMIGLDVTLQTMIDQKDIKQWQTIPTNAAKAITEMTTYYYTNEYSGEEFGGALHDPLAVAAAIDPAILTQVLPINLTVETTGPSIGRTIGDLTGLNNPIKSAAVGLAVDSTAFLEDFFTITNNFLMNVKSI
ncbi:nucleoside hydrolase [Enterococcus sp. 669A]|uniref:Nucleoside hydrolase n=1 Tax=Candidatus Enterococcus moelleringii TaxID=2815325 RepID=A0ABS3LAC3_9ENTE|nr:nucleoside hydrolase [Enterococcus sp. 669A]MBO1306583.1 nucleoside hydrolase [Enterococcus sp. 669A]